MKKTYLLLAIIGFLLPNYFVLQESIETGNYLLYADVPATINGMFANRISSIFTIDLLFGVVVFFIWSYQYQQSLGWNKLGLTWVITMLFGFASGFPLFLYFRLTHSQSKPQASQSQGEPQASQSQGEPQASQSPSHSLSFFRFSSRIRKNSSTRSNLFNSLYFRFI